tara:strand:- start:6934 stop:7302 length:369 start_codon:yes stop_codon:yes gene_type:complete
MNKWLEFNEEKFEEWVDEFSARLEEENADMATMFRTSYMEVKDTPNVTKWAFWLYNELVYSNDSTLNSIAWPMNMAFLDMMTASFTFRGMNEEAQKTQVMGKEILELAVKMYSRPESTGEEE